MMVGSTQWSSLLKAHALYLDLKTRHADCGAFKATYA